MQAMPLLSLQKHFSQAIQNEEESCDERMAVYQNAYFMKILESMEEDFPKTRALLGEDLFSQLVREYITQMPPKYWSVAQVGERFGEFIPDSGWDTRFPSVLGTIRLEWLLILSDMASIDKTFDFSLLAQLTPVQQQNVILCLSPSVHLFASDVKKVIFRSPEQVEQLELSESQWELLNKISQKISIGDLVAGLSEVDPADVTQWFSKWVSLGMISTWNE